MSLALAFCFTCPILGTPSDEKVPVSGTQQVVALQQFSLSVLGHQLEAASGNVILAPYGLFEVTAQLHAGSADLTQVQLAELLGADRAGDIAGGIARFRQSGLRYRWELPFTVVDNERYGLLVKNTPPAVQTPGLAAGDLVLKVDGATVQSLPELDLVLKAPLPNTVIEFYDVSSGDVASATVPLSRRVATSGAEPPLAFASVLWLDRRLRPAPETLALLRDGYKTQVLPWDFSRPLGIDHLTAAVEKQLGNRLQRVYSPPALPPNTRAVLLNIVDLRADWLHRFSPQKTQTGEFAAPDGPVSVHYMRQTEWFPFFEEASLQAIDLPYAGSDLSMLLLLPTDPQGLDQLEASVLEGNGFLDRIMAALKDEEVDLTLPRFRFSSHGSMKSLLQSMGVTLPFSADADFRPLAGRPGIRLDDVLQQSMIEVDERGTRISSETVAVGVALSAGRRPQFRASHPFLFVVHDSRGAIFFAGRVSQPTVAR